MCQAQRPTANRGLGYLILCGVMIQGHPALRVDCEGQRGMWETRGAHRRHVEHAGDRHVEHVGDRHVEHVGDRHVEHVGDRHVEHVGDTCSMWKTKWTFSRLPSRPTGRNESCPS